MHSVVLDTNVVIAALRSRRGASFAILRRLGQAWVPLISVPLILERLGIQVMIPRAFLKTMEEAGT